MTLLSPGESFEDLWKRMKRDTEIHCPHCDEQYPDEEYRHVSYHGEDSQDEIICEDCGKKFWLEEHVRRTYTTAKTRKGLDSEEDDE